MKPSPTYTLILAIALFCFAVVLSSCGGGSSTSNSSAPTLPSASSLPASCTSATLGSSYSCSITVSSGKAPFKWAVTGLPSGLSFTVSADTTTLTISGTPKAQAAHAEILEFVQITVTDANAQSDLLSFNIALTTTALSITTPSPLPAGTAGTAYTAMVTASGGTSPYKWTISGLPAGLIPTSGTPSATISGTTDLVGTFSVTATVSDSESTPATASVTLSLTIAQAATLMVTTTTLPNGTLNTVYSQTLAATGGVSPYSWTVASGSLPTGLLLSTAGVISGKPSVSGSFTFTVQASDAESPAQTAKQALSITINSTSSALSITTSSPLTNATLNSAYTATVTATGGTPPYTWSLGSSSALPSVLSLTSGSPSATISGTPTATGTFQFTLDVKDSAGTPATASASFLLTVTGSSTLNCPTTVSLTLCGTYFIGIGGFNSGGGPTDFGGSFVANNSGDVISGTKAANDSVAGFTTSTITGGSYVMDSSGDGRGILTLIDSDANTSVFRFVLESAANAGPGVIEQFDSTGTLASGIVFGPVATPLTPLPANGVFGLVLEGLNSAGDRARVLGMMKIGASGCDGSSGSLNSLSGEPVVSNVAGTVDKALTLTGSCTASDPNTGVGTAQLTIGGGTPFSNTTLNFLYINIEEGAFFLEKDAVGSNQPILAGIGLGIGLPTGGFNASSLGCPCILDAQGATNGNASTGGAISSIVRIVTTPGAGSSGTLTGVLDQNDAGTVTLEGTWPYTSYTVDSNGVGTITGTGSPMHFIATGSGGNGFTFYTVDESSEVQGGTFREQNATSIGNPNSPYIMGRDLSIQGITHTTSHVLGVITPTGATSGSLTGTADVISDSGSFPGVSLTGTYTSIDTTTGRGTGTANLTDDSSAVSIVMYVTRGRQFLVLDVESSNPYVVGARLQ